MANVYRNKMTLSFFKNFKMGFYPMDPLALKMRNIIHSLNQPACRESNKHCEVNVEIFTSPKMAFVEYEFLNGVKYSFKGDQISLTNILEPVVYTSDHLYYEEVFCENDQLLMKNIDDDPK